MRERVGSLRGGRRKGGRWLRELPREAQNEAVTWGVVWAFPGEPCTSPFPSPPSIFPAPKPWPLTTPLPWHLSETLWKFL